MADNENEDQVTGGQDAQGADDTQQDVAADEALKQELEKTRDQLMRIAAEADNTKKRAARDVADARRYSITGLARDLLDVADNMSRALSALPPEARETGSDNLKGLVAGIELTSKSLHDALKKHGVTKINPQGEKFDPNTHEAIAQIPSTAPAGQVVEVIQPGYVLGDRTLRAAMVAVSSGQPPVPAEKATESGADDAQPGSNIDTTA